MKYMKTAIVSAIACFSIGQASAWNVAEFYSTLGQSAVNNLSPGANPVLIYGAPVSFPANGKAFFNAVNIANPNTGSNFMQFSPDVWSAAQWTGLEPVDRSSQAQSGLSYSDNLPSYGNNVVQIDGGKVGMFLNTYNLVRPRPEILSSALQFANYFAPARTVWTQFDGSSLLCANGLIDLHSWQGSKAQAIVTMSFEEYGSNRFFFLNIFMLDTNPSSPVVESVIDDNPADTGAPIALTYFQTQNSQNLLSRYSSPIPSYGQILEPFQKTSSKPASYVSSPKNYGVCISRQQFGNILQDIRARRPQFSADPSAYRLSLTLYTPEIAGEGTVGMSIHDANVYRLAP